MNKKLKAMRRPKNRYSVVATLPKVVDIVVAQANNCLFNVLQSILVR